MTAGDFVALLGQSHVRVTWHSLQEDTAKHRFIFVIQPVLLHLLHLRVSTLVAPATFVHDRDNG